MKDGESSLEQMDLKPNKSREFPNFWTLGSYKYPFYRSILYNFVQSYARNASLVLDAGCGEKGGYLVTLPKNVWGIGLDIDPQHLEKSVKNSKNLQCDLSFLAGDLEKLPFGKNIFSLIICCDVLEHVRNPEKAIEQLSFCLKRGGKLIIGTTNEFNLFMYLDKLLPKKISATITRKFGAHHLERTRRFNPWSLTKKLNKHGLKLEMLLMLGYPPIGQPAIYHYSRTKPPMMYHFWILYDKMTCMRGLTKLKEEMLIIASPCVRALV